MNSRAADQVFDLADIDTRRLSEVNYLPQLFRTQSRSMSFVNDVELAAAALAHVRRLLIQCLKHAEVPKAHIWEEELLRILVKVATYPLPKVKEGDSMDVRRYIKIKRVPGGTPADSEYVDGIVFTKSMLNKSLPTFISHPRIMVFNYAFEFEHDETKMARLDTLRDSEKDSLRKLANSIIDHRPHVVLVGKNVSGLALDYLHKANIVVARNVKPSVLEIVARCTRAGIFNTYQHFPETTRLGRCQVFRSDTIVHKLIPGKRKTLMRFEGCSRDLGGTVILRGGDVATLSKIKRIMHFMVLAVYSARLEMCLFWDEHAAIPPAIELSRLRDVRQDEDDSEPDISYFSAKNSDDQPQDTAQKETDKLIKQALRPYTSTILSTSPTIIFPPPHSLERLRIDNDRIEELRTHHRQERTITHGSELQPQQTQTQQDSFAAPVTVSKGGEPEAALQTSAALTRSLSEVSLLSVKPQTKTKVLKISAELAEASQIAEAQKKRDEHLAIWEKRLARHQDDLDPAAHQHLSILETVICATTLKACDGPRLVRRYFYNKGSDLTLRQYVERTVLASSHRCPAKGCEKPMLAHYTTYAHGEQRLHMVLESYPFVRQNPEVHRHHFKYQSANCRCRISFSGHTARFVAQQPTSLRSAMRPRITGKFEQQRMETSTKDEYFPALRNILKSRSITASSIAESYHARTIYTEIISGTSRIEIWLFVSGSILSTSRTCLSHHCKSVSTLGRNCE
jgi:1-phosphatidylinositol-3-phosphate 5-kinase